MGEIRVKLNYAWFLLNKYKSDLNHRKLLIKILEAIVFDCERRMSGEA